MSKAPTRSCLTTRLATFPVVAGEARAADHSHGPQGSAGEKDFTEFLAYAQGQSGQDAIRLGGCRLGLASGLRTTECGVGDRCVRDAPIAASAAGDAGRHCRPHRLHLARSARRPFRKWKTSRSTPLAALIQSSLAAGAGRPDRRSRKVWPISEAPFWSGFFVPKGTPQAVIDKLQKGHGGDDRDAGPDRSPQEGRLRLSFLSPRPTQPALKKFLDGEIEKWCNHQGKRRRRSIDAPMQSECLRDIELAGRGGSPSGMS